MSNVARYGLLSIVAVGMLITYWLSGTVSAFEWNDDGDDTPAELQITERCLRTVARCGGCGPTGVRRLRLLNPPSHPRCVGGEPDGCNSSGGGIFRDFSQAKFHEAAPCIGDFTLVSGHCSGSRASGIKCSNVN